MKKSKIKDSLSASAKISMRTKYKSRWFMASVGLIAFIIVAICFLHQMGVTHQIQQALSENNNRFYWMLLAGFLAEIVAGSMGMGYGVICTTILLWINVPPPAISASIHTAESFTSAAGSFSHYKLKNVNKKMVKSLVLPAVIGAVLGALSVVYLGDEQHYASLVKPFIAVYTIYLGVRILRNAFRSHEQRIQNKKKLNIPALGFFGGFIDSFAGGGWGPLVTATFIKNGYTPRYVIGSSTFTSFILTITSSIVFISTLHFKYWDVVAGLLIGGVITAPFSAMLTSKIPIKKMFLIVGGVVIIMGMINVYKSIISWLG